jgi:hypothetical protein
MFEFNNLDEIYSFFKIKMKFSLEKNFQFCFDILDKYSPNFSKVLRSLNKELSYSVLFLIIR